MTKEQLRRISELTALSRTRSLTLQEQEERDMLRRMYLESVRENLRDQLEKIEFTN